MHKTCAKWEPQDRRKDGASRPGRDLRSTVVVELRFEGRKVEGQRAEEAGERIKRSELERRVQRIW
jgi:hypothetical protein